MDINGSNIKPQTGGLKLMTVFIAVLALHVVVIGGFVCYRLIGGDSTDADLTTTDKTHKGMSGTSVTDGALPDATQPDKTTAAPPTEVATIPANPTTPATTTAPASAPAPDVTSSPAITASASTPEPTTASSTTAPAPASVPATTPASTPAPAPAPAAELTASTPTPEPTPAPAPVTEIANPGSQTPSGPISSLAPPPEPVSAAVPAPSLVLAPAPTPALAPVLAPAPALATGPVHMPPAEKSAEAPHEHMKVYIVKITDSYKKIAVKHHITVAQLKEANHITNNVLHTGQKLYIPSEKGEMADKTQVAAKAATSTLSASPVASESPAPITTGLTTTSTTVASTGLHHHLYTVVKGDTLTKIAHRYKTTASAIMAENGITDPTKLSIGKKLRIPSAESRSARATPVTPQPSQVQAKTSAPTAQLANYGN